MKALFLSLILIYLTPSNPLEHVRSAFQKASLSEENTLAFSELIKADLNIDENLQTVYLGAAETLMAKYGSSPASKLRLFKNGVAKIEEAVVAEPSNVEIRLVRLIIQDNAPSMLMYSGEIEKDKAFIIKHCKHAPSNVKKFVQKVVENTDIFSQEELTQLK